MSRREENGLLLDLAQDRVATPQVPIERDHLAWIHRHLQAEAPTGSQGDVRHARLKLRRG